MKDHVALRWAAKRPKLAMLLAVPAMAAALAASASDLYTRTSWPIPESELDRLVFGELRQHGLEPAPPCADAVFLRRVYLDLIGTLPTPAEVIGFLEDKSPDKRAALVDFLLERDEYADYWAMRWGDVLRIKSEFPINLWPNAVQAYHRWVHDALRANMPYNEFARRLLTSSGSNFRVPEVNFCRAVQGQDPRALAAAVALTFLASRLDAWPEDRRDGLTALFSRVAFKGTAEWKEEIVMFDPRVAEGMQGMMPDGTTVEIDRHEDPRIAFADWLIDGSGRDWFCRAMVNRTWAWLFGRGLVHEADDIRPENPPVHPKAFAHLAGEFARQGSDVKELLRLIVNSRCYQQSCLARSESAEAIRHFACYPVRRMDAEVLIDALCQLTGTGESYSSQIPEPFTFIPEDQRTVALADGSITSAFLEMFGRPPRDTGLMSERNRKPSDAQALHLLNSTHLQNKLERSGKIRALLRKHAKNPRAAVRTVYLALLSRRPANDEVQAALDYARTPGINHKQAADDLVWALVNSKEFLYHH